MSKVFLHIHDPHQANWINQMYEFARIPIEGEHLTVSTDSAWYRVELVVHTPFSDDMDAEVYAVKVDHSEVKRRKLNTRPGVTFE